MDSGQKDHDSLNYNPILNLVEEGKNVDVVYLDSAEAFDEVDHGIL